MLVGVVKVWSKS